MEQGHILKFVSRGKTFDENVGIRVYPRQTYGVSEQSPDHFKQSYSLIGEHGYLYSHQTDPEFEYASQKKYVDVYQSGKDQQNYGSLHEKLNENSLMFHKKKGRLSEFMDKNGWMSPVTTIMGFERNENARLISNQERERRIKSLKPKMKYQNVAKLRVTVNPEYYNTISSLMTQKLRIRKKRNQLAERYETVKLKTGERVVPIQAEDVARKMAKTSNDFYSTQSTFCHPASNLKERRAYSKESNKQYFKKRSQSPSFQQKPSGFKIRQASRSKRTPQYPAAEENSLEFKDDVQKWYRTTCKSNWVYNPHKLDTEERGQSFELQIDKK